METMPWLKRSACTRALPLVLAGASNKAFVNERAHANQRRTSSEDRRAELTTTCYSMREELSSVQLWLILEVEVGSEESGDRIRCSIDATFRFGQ